MRSDKRPDDGLRPVEIHTGFQKNPDGSALVIMGGTKVICAANAESGVPSFLSNSGQGWITAEYSMLPGSTHSRVRREKAAGGRSQEIQRLIGRSLRSVCDLMLLGEQTITIDCDVLEADGGTRTAAITGAFVALALAVKRLRGLGLIGRMPIQDSVAAVSCGLVSGRPTLDLCYEEDSTAQVDMNVVITGRGRLVEVQGTAEGAPFDRTQLDALLSLAETGCHALADVQRRTLGSLYDEIAAGHP